MKYEVTAPLAYSRPTGGTTRRGAPAHEVVHCEPGEIIDLDDFAAQQLHRKIQPFIEPPRPRTKRPNRYTEVAPNVPESPDAAPEAAPEGVPPEPVVTDG